MMKHVLDNPAFNALNTGNKKLANGNGHIKYFNKAVSPFMGFDENTNANFQELYKLTNHDSLVVFISPDEVSIPGPWRVTYYVMCFQMVYHNPMVTQMDDSALVILTEEHIPKMLALTKLTNPGPFAERTIDFGHYLGIFQGDNLVAMAGQRMNPLPYAEISAVCTHPDYLGRGYAKLLMQYQINRIIAEGNIPFLHVKCDNDRAIKVYQSLGFEMRAKLHFYMLEK